MIKEKKSEIDHLVEFKNLIDDAHRPPEDRVMREEYGDNDDFADSPEIDE